ncbi:17397_t:CDS:2, partial [Gigaspora margarita]
MEDSAPNQEEPSDMGWEGFDNDTPSEIHVSLNNLISRTQNLLVEEKKIVAQPCEENDIDEDMVDQLTVFIEELPTRKE